MSIDDNTSDLAEQQIDRQRRAMRGDGGGASVTMKDARLSRLIEWVQPVVSSLVVAGLLYFANKVGDLSDSIAQTNIQMALTRQQSTTMVEELKDHEGRIRALEGRTFRGLPGYEASTEAKRGH